MTNLVTPSKIEMRKLKLAIEAVSSEVMNNRQ